MDGQSQAIELKGIVRNKTKIGVQDGQCEDLLNLRYKDGSWRTSGDGKKVYSMTDNANGYVYEQLFVHTNVYRHVLGVRNGMLYWFASIDSDGETFTPLDTPVEVTNVSGDIYVSQTGHLITVIDDTDDFDYIIFKTYTNEYKKLYVDVNGKASDRVLYPYGRISFNLNEPSDDDHTHRKQHTNDVTWNNATIQIAHADMLEMFAEATEKNQFTSPFLVIAACRLYDGTHAFASQPVLLFPRELTAFNEHFCKETGTVSADAEETVTDAEVVDSDGTDTGTIGFIAEQHSVRCLDTDTEEHTGEGQTYTNPLTFSSTAKLNLAIIEKPAAVFVNKEHVGTSDNMSVIPLSKDAAPVYAGGISVAYGISFVSYCHNLLVSCVRGSDISLYIENTDIIDGDLITGIDIFVTQQADVIKLDSEAYKDSPFYDSTASEEDNLLKNHKQYKNTHYIISGGSSAADIEAHSAPYFPTKNTLEDIISTLINSPFYLVKQYNKLTISELSSSRVVDLSGVESEGVLQNITQQDKLEVEAISRQTYLPKCSYVYNGRLHIANYKTYPFFGFPIDMFQLHNHALKYESGTYFKGVLKDLADDKDMYKQFVKDQINITDLGDDGAAIENGVPYFLVRAYIESSQGEQIVCRYIPAYDVSTTENGRADFVEDLNPLLTFPDARAKKLEIYYIHHYSDGDNGALVNIGASEGYYMKRGVFELTPHPYLNMAYYIDPELKPIKLADFEYNPVIQQLVI